MIAKGSIFVGVVLVLQVAMTTPMAAADVIPDNTAPGTPVCLVGEVDTCAGNEALEEECSWWGMYEIDVQADGETGTVEARVACGDDELTCDINLDEGEIECHQSFVDGPGDLVCKATVPTGVTVTGGCKDPANPAVVYPLVVTYVNPNGLKVN